MGKMEDTLKNIEALRMQMDSIIENRQGDLTDSEVVNASRNLNEELNKYNEMMNGGLQ